jgi:mRNA interferase RelE/StbE
LAWTLRVADQARRQLKKIDQKQADRITLGMMEIACLDNPRLRGKAMAGKYAGHWRYRFGDYRVIARLEDGRMTILVIAVGHRRDVYR